MLTLSSLIRREQLGRRAERLLASFDERIALAERVENVIAAAKAAPDSPNQRHAAFAVLRAARLVSVGNWLAAKCRSRLQQLEKQMAKDVMSHKGGFGPDALPSIFTELDREAAAAFDWLKGELADDADQLHKILLQQAISAGAGHFTTTAGSGQSPAGSNPSAQKLVLGAPLSDHLDKIQSDLLFRLKAALRQAADAGCTAREAVERLGLELTPEAEVIASTRRYVTDAGEVVHAAAGLDDALKAISVGVRLFDTTDNSVAKLLQAAVTAIASDADALSFDAMGAGDQMGFTWVSAGDVRVCEFCQFMDGGTWDADKQPVGDSPDLETEPPAHFGCRCSLLPCDLGEPLPSGGFESYLNQFSQSEQEQAFGKAALNAYRKGEITPAALMGQGDNRISLEQLRGMEPRLELDSAKYEAMGKAGGEAAGRSMEAARQARIAEELGVKP